MKLRVRFMGHAKVIILGTVATILCISGTILLHVMDAPASATHISNGPPPPVSPVLSTSIGSPVEVTGTNVSFSYPSIFTPTAQQPVEGDILASYGYERRMLTSWQLTVTVVLLPGGQRDGDSAYYAATQDPARYSESAEVVNGNSAIVMTDKTFAGFSKVAFLFHGSYSADVSLNSEDAEDATEEQSALNMVLQSWRWE